MEKFMGGTIAFVSAAIIVLAMLTPVKHFGYCIAGGVTLTILGVAIYANEVQKDRRHAAELEMIEVP